MSEYRKINHCNIISGRQKELLETLGVPITDHVMNTSDATQLINATKDRQNGDWKTANVDDILD